MSEKVKELIKWAEDAGSGLTDLVRFAAFTIADRDAEIERLKAALPYDWDMLEACRGSLREHMAEIKRLRGLLLRIRAWDHLDGAADGSFWKREIDAAMEDKT